MNKILIGIFLSIFVASNVFSFTIKNAYNNKGVTLTVVQNKATGDFRKTLKYGEQEHCSWGDYKCNKSLKPDSLVSFTADTGALRTKGLCTITPVPANATITLLGTGGGGGNPCEMSIFVPLR